MDYSQSESSFEKKGEDNSSTGATFSCYKKPGNFSVKKYVKDEDEKGLYANKCPEIKAKGAKGAFKVRKMGDYSVKEEGTRKQLVRFASGIRISNAEREDPFMRYWIILSNLGQVGIGTHNKGHLAKIFADTGAD